MITKTEAINISAALRSMYGTKPALEVIELARADKALIQYGVTHVKDVFIIAQELNKVGA